MAKMSKTVTLLIMIFPILIILMIVVGFGISIYLMIEDSKDDYYCEDMGYEHSGDNLGVIDGYIECCEKVVVDYRYERRCEIIQDTR